MKRHALVQVISMFAAFAVACGSSPRATPDAGHFDSGADTSPPDASAPDTSVTDATTDSADSSTAADSGDSPIDGAAPDAAETAAPGDVGTEDSAADTSDTTDSAGDGGTSADGATEAGAPDAGAPEAAPTRFTVGGTVTGLAPGATLVVQDNGQDDESVTADGSFAFPTALPAGATFDVTVLTQPSAPSQTCVVTGATGVLGATDATSVAIACTTRTFPVGGTLTGLAGGSLVLTNNGGDALTLSSNGAFAFPTSVASGAPYLVTVETQPGTQTCTVSAGSGNVMSGAVTTVAVLCGGGSYTVGGTVSGLAAGDELALKNNGGDELFVSQNGAFAFATPVDDGSAYAVTVANNPSTPIAQICTVTNGSGTSTTNVSSISVACVTSSVAITLTNAQSSPVPPSFPVLLTINSSTYAQSLAADWSNALFTSSATTGGATLQAWIMANPQNSSATTQVWVQLPGGIPAMGSTTIYLNFTVANQLSASGPLGEAPNLSATYGQYDNGALMGFLQYTGFEGTSFAAGWTGDGTVNKGFQGAGGSCVVIPGNLTNYTTGIGYMNFTSLITTDPGSSPFLCWDAAGSCSATKPIPAGGGIVSLANPGTAPAFFITDACGATLTETVPWAFVAPSPPNNVYPTATFL